MNIYVVDAIEKEIERLEQDKRRFPNDEWMYEPDLSNLKKELKGMKRC